jgi:hypothetical protein
MFVHVSMGGLDTERVILPNLTNAAAPIGPHTAFVMIPKGARISSTGSWQTPLTTTDEGIDYEYFLLNGDDLSFSNNTDRLDTTQFHKNVLKLKTLCPSFQKIKESYLLEDKPDEKIAQLNVTHGTLATKIRNGGMLASELTLQGKQLTITAHSWRDGSTRELVVGPKAEVWIANVTNRFLDPTATHIPDPDHFQAYYAMSDQPVKCAGPKNTAPPSHGSDPGKDFDISCSNSHFP